MENNHIYIGIVIFIIFVIVFMKLKGGSIGFFASGGKNSFSEMENRVNELNKKVINIIG